MGTPASAVAALRTLDRHAAIALVITRGDRRRGRSTQKTPSEVKRAATELGLEVACPEHRTELEQALRGVAPVRLGVVAAYGMLLTPAILRTAELGFVNLHYSLLPRWRGAAPVAAAIRAGDPETGVSLMRITPGLDAGPVLASVSTPITDRDTRGTLTERLSQLGAELLAREWQGLWAGEWREVPQDEQHATYAPRLQPRDGLLSFARGAEELARQVRALAPRPGAYAHRGGARMRILAARGSSASPLPLRPGELGVASGELWCGCGDGALILDEIQPQGKRVMPGAAWARGVRGELGYLTEE